MIAFQGMAQAGVVVQAQVAAKPVYIDRFYKTAF